MIASPVLLGTLVAGAALLAIWLERLAPGLTKVGSALLALALGALLSNTGLVATSSPVYEAVAGPVTLLAIAWLLLAVRLEDLRLIGPRMATAFALAVGGTVAGALAGAAIFRESLGDDAWRLAGTLTGTYSGGSLNFVSVARAVELPDRIFAGATAADALFTGLWLTATILLPGLIGRFYGPLETRATARTESRAAPRSFGTPLGEPLPRSASGIFRVVVTGLALVALAELASKGLSGLPESRLSSALGSVPTVLWLTTLALIAGRLPGIRNPPGAMLFGTVALHLFFVVIGIWSRVGEIIAVGPEVALYTLLVVVVHGVVVFGGGRLARLDVASIAVASQAAVGGPASAIAVATARRWPAMVLPGIVVGLLGYALGTYLGLLVAALTRYAL